MKVAITFVIVLLLTSCQEHKKKFVTVRIDIEDCSSSLYFKKLDHVLMTNSGSDFGGKREKGYLIDKLLYPEAKFIKDLQKSRDGFFYVDSVERGEYFYFYIESDLSGSNFSAMKRKNDFSNSLEDTVVVKFCMEPPYKIIN